MNGKIHYTIRNYRRGDEEALIQILSECFGPSAAGEVRRKRRRLERSPESLFVGEVEGRVVSSVRVKDLKLHVGEGNYIPTCGVAGVCTDSDYRRRGIATSLLKACLQHARMRGISNASLFTATTLPAHRIYTRLGFVDITNFQVYIRYLDFKYAFKSLIRHLNRRLKWSKAARRKLSGWRRLVVIDFEGVGPLGLRLGEDGFRTLGRPPKRPDIHLSTDVQTFTGILWDSICWEEAMKTGRLRVRRGSTEDIEMLRRILQWVWEDSP